MSHKVPYQINPIFLHGETVDAFIEFSKFGESRDDNILAT